MQHGGDGENDLIDSQNGTPKLEANANANAEADAIAKTVKEAIMPDAISDNVSAAELNNLINNAIQKLMPSSANNGIETKNVSIIKRKGKTMKVDTNYKPGAKEDDSNNRLFGRKMMGGKKEVKEKKKKKKEKKKKEQNL